MKKFSPTIVMDMVLARGAGNSWAAISRQYGIAPATAKRIVRDWALEQHANKGG